MKIRRQFGGLIVAVVLAFTGMFTGTAFAAGSANFTVEPSATSVQTGASLTLNVFVNASGANLYGAQIDVSLTNMTFTSYAPPSTSVFPFAQVVTGGSAGSTSFTIAVSQQGANPGATGKQLMGTVTVSASSNAGTATANLSGGQAAEAGTFSSMAATNGSASVTITAPATPPAQTCAAGQTGTYPACVTPSTGSTSGTTNQPTNQAKNPNPASKANIPTSTPGGSETVPEQTVATAYTAAVGTDTTKTVAATSKVKKSSINMTFAALGGVAVLAIVGGAAFLMMRKRRFSGFGSTAPASQVFTSSMTGSTPQQPVEAPKDDQIPPTTPSGPVGPTVITPQ